MKVWYGFGSEHSANLVMIGRFKDADAAHKAKEAIERLAEQYSNDARVDSATGADNSDRYSENMLKLLQEVNIHSVRPAEFEQLNYNIHVELKGKEIRVTTDEIEISAFLKILFDKGAKIEVYSAHDYPDEEAKQ
jgi:hypothetical protein